MPPLRHRGTIVAAIAVLAALVATAPASASRKANAQQRAALSAAIMRTPVGDLGRAERHKPFRITGQRISTVSPSWATATLVPKPKFQARVQGGYVIAVRLGGTKTWVVVDAGTAMVGCGIAPNSVIADLLGITPVSDACPDGEGVE
jgi:predicted aspartyl protease